MIGFAAKLETRKGGFFDRPKVMCAADRATRKVLSKFGAFVRQCARTSIKPAPKSAKARAKRGITAEGTSQPGGPPVSHSPHLLKKFILFSFEAAPRKSVVIGPARLGGKIGNAPEALETGGESEAMVGPKARRRRVKTRVRARPYMLPAFQAELPGVPKLWANSIK